MSSRYLPIPEAQTQDPTPRADILYRTDETGERLPLVFVILDDSDTLAQREQTLQDYSENTTSQPSYSSVLIIRLQQLFAEAQDELFEDGIESEFSRKLSELTRVYAGNVIDALGDLVLAKKANSEVSAQALRWLGSASAFLFKEKIRLLLERVLLQSESAQIRDGALLGLAFINSKRSITSIERAIKKEHVADLRQDMIDYLRYLKNPEDISDSEN